MINVFSNGEVSRDDDEQTGSMRLESRVGFICEIPVLGGYAVRKESFKTIDELKATVKKHHKSDTPYGITVIRGVKVVGRNNKHNVYSTVANEKIVLFVCDKLMYPADARRFLLKKYGRVFDFDVNEHEKNIPLRSLNVLEHQSVGLRTEHGPTNIHWHSVYCEQARPQDIIVNPDLQQIWPQRTGTIPKALTELLARNKEIIR